MKALLNLAAALIVVPPVALALAVAGRTDRARDALLDLLDLARDPDPFD